MLRGTKKPVLTHLGVVSDLEELDSDLMRRIAALIELRVSLRFVHVKEKDRLGGKMEEQKGGKRARE